MQKIIIVTGATSGIGLATSKALLKKGHQVLIHGRNESKLEGVKQDLLCLGSVESYLADLSNFEDVKALAASIAAKHDKIDVLINNAGVFKVATPLLPNGLDLRFVVNTLSPYLLTQSLLPLMDSEARVVNLSSAAQAPVDLDAMRGTSSIHDDFQAYAQSKLAITMWSTGLAHQRGDQGPVVVSVNPGSLLNTKMVSEAFGPSTKDVGIGADILVRAALSDEFASSSGKYFDNDSGQFAAPHPAGQDMGAVEEVIATVESILAEK